MGFEEDFPSLKVLKANNDVPYYREFDVVTLGDVNKYCLDKQKVREAWEKYKKQWDNGNPLSPNELKKELGL